MQVINSLLKLVAIVIRASASRHPTHRAQRARHDVSLTPALYSGAGVMGGAQCREGGGLSRKARGNWAHADQQQHIAQRMQLALDDGA